LFINAYKCNPVKGSHFYFTLVLHIWLELCQY